MSDTLIAALIALVAIGLIKLYSSKPQDSEGRTILSVSDRVLGAVVLALCVTGIVFVKADLYGIGNPLILLSPILIGIYVIYGRLQIGNKKNKK